MHVTITCPNCLFTNRVEIEGVLKEAFTCERCGTELLLLRVDHHYHVVRG